MGESYRCNSVAPPLILESRFLNHRPFGKEDWTETTDEQPRTADGLFGFYLDRVPARLTLVQ
jgi:hypothetical protein